MPTYATYRLGQELDLSQYTLEDLFHMSSDEMIALLGDFERVYDPFGTYETNPIIEVTQSPSIQPMWGSNDPEGENEENLKGHSVITMQAIEMLINDLGFYYDNSNPTSNIFAALIITLGASYPDHIQSEIGLFAFEGHFYHAIDGDSWTGSTTNTALTNCVRHFNQAVSYYKSGNENVYLELGMALHYLQDAAEPHHAANITIVNPAHWQFENYVDERIDSYTAHITSLNDHNGYVSARTQSVDSMVKSAALNGYAYADDVDSILDKSQWDQAARITVRVALESSAKLLYKFARSAGITLHHISS